MHSHAEKVSQNPPDTSFPCSAWECIPIPPQIPYSHGAPENPTRQWLFLMLPDSYAFPRREVVAKPSGHLVPMLRVGMHTDPATNTILAWSPRKPYRTVALSHAARFVCIPTQRGCRKTLRTPRSHAPRGNAYRSRHKYHTRMEPPKTLPDSGSFSCCQIRMHSHAERLSQNPPDTSFPCSAWECIPIPPQIPYSHGAPENPTGQWLFLMLPDSYAFPRGEVVAKPSGHLVPMLRVGMHTDPATNTILAWSPRKPYRAVALSHAARFVCIPTQRGCRKTLRTPRSHAPRGNAYRSRHKYHTRMEPPKTLPGSGSFSCCQIRMHSHAERGNEVFATTSRAWERGGWLYGYWHLASLILQLTLFYTLTYCSQNEGQQDHHSKTL